MIEHILLKCLDFFQNEKTQIWCIIELQCVTRFKIPKKVLKKYLKKCKIIIDHDGAWKNYDLGSNYHLSGDTGWI